MSADIGLFYHELFFRHGAKGHPENVRRLTAILDHLLNTGWLERLVRTEFSAASPEQGYPADHAVGVRVGVEVDGGRIGENMNRIDLPA